jgi:hypothetical protein
MQQASAQELGSLNKKYSSRQHKSLYSTQEYVDGRFIGSHGSKLMILNQFQNSGGVDEFTTLYLIIV